jgi:hypothetical protein
MLTFVRYFSLAGAADADPTVAQPDPDTYGLPIIPEKGGSVLINAWEVDAAGRRVTPTPGLALTLGIVTVSRVGPVGRPVPLATLTEPQKFWGRGALSTAQEPGWWQIQTELGNVVGFSVVVTAKTGTPATYLSIWADLQGAR